MLRVPRYGLRDTGYSLQSAWRIGPSVKSDNSEILEYSNALRYAPCAMHKTLGSKIPNTEFCPLSVGIGRQVNEHPLKVGIGYIGLALEIGGGSAGDQMAFVDNPDTLTDILGDCQCVR
jgi:hypothetical protein